MWRSNFIKRMEKIKNPDETNNQLDTLLWQDCLSHHATLSYDMVRYDLCRKHPKSRILDLIHKSCLGIKGDHPAPYSIISATIVATLWEGCNTLTALWCNIENKRVNKTVLHWLSSRLCVAMMEPAPGQILIHQYFAHNQTPPDI